MKKPTKGRKSYQPPKVTTAKIYERYGLACGKNSPMDANCLKNIMS